MPPSYSLTPAAKADLREIWLYTLENWGEAQADRYLFQLEECCERLVEHPELGRPRDELRRGYRSLLEGSHLIIYRYHLDRIEIIRVLHRRMDPERHL